MTVTKAGEKLSDMLGKIVFYRLTADDAAEIARRRSLVHYAGGTPAAEGDVYPCIITRVNPYTMNGKVVLDGTDHFWVVDITEGVGVRTFSLTPQAAVPVDPSGYPRAMHKPVDGGFQSRTVATSTEEEAAKADGFQRDVPLTADQKKAVAAAKKNEPVAVK